MAEKLNRRSFLQVMTIATMSPMVLAETEKRVRFAEAGYVPCKHCEAIYEFTCSRCIFNPEKGQAKPDVEAYMQEWFGMSHKEWIEESHTKTVIHTNGQHKGRSI